ncbi:lignostilbene dioxygenase family protein [Colletotrichum tofieldiae]|uniref:Lignostilbene dioxygenase family protein n=1 Tax=Colletotrichum tofieldiae TaxID=708197 RepID=A0A166PA36_9PEZI|nr:lignostilbene dioxygenase family protein [Colletotrichum tofieldiae]GKT54368.1 lignostilbene dioxygenase family protein [Colletotrichum tofieldiae]GKT74085.1 lignostilbene dioxygenase family protein [Colletotrichum tofieldiae]GKT96077.1 lignostilbene dioxygenase family protein [Colletotrichum tofieldiae]
MAAQLVPLKGAENLQSRWHWSEDLGGFDMPIRLEGEIGDVMVRGTIPDNIDGTFYRVAGDHFTPTPKSHSPLDGHGAVSAFRIHKGQVDFKIRYVQNDRYKVERNRKRSFFVDIQGHPMRNHPCVRAVMEQTSNINVVHWAGKLHALNEGGQAWTMDPDTLDTTGSNPYGNQVSSSATFTGHPKIDQGVDELITWGFSFDFRELISYSITRQGEVKNLHRILPKVVGPIHDVAITDNWLVFCQWPVSPSDPKEDVGKTRLLWDTERPTTFIVAPRRPDQPLAGSGWKPYEFRTYTHSSNSEIVHTGGAWEENGKVFFEGTWPNNPLFPFWGTKQQKPTSDTTVVDFVRFEIDVTQPDQAVIADPTVLVDIPNEFPRIDERYYCKPHDHVFMNVFYSSKKEPLRTEHIFQGLNATAMLNKRTNELKVYSPGPHCRCQEPVFVPRSDDSSEGDGYIIFAVDRLDINLTNLVILDTKDFENPIAVIELPLRMRAQVHGNWVDARELSGQPLVPNPLLNN